MPAPSLAAAEGVVPFQVHVPLNLGEAVTIYTTDPGTPLQDAIVQFVYDTSTHGRVVVFERLPEVPEDEYNTDIEQRAARYTGAGIAEIHSIRGGTEALLESFDSGAGFGLYWLENGVEYWLGGPALTSDEILAIAEAV